MGRRTEWWSAATVLVALALEAFWPSPAEEMPVLDGSNSLEVLRTR
jgi:hypothetical protein